MPNKSVVDQLTLYLEQIYKAQLDSVFTNESMLGFSYNIIKFTYKRERFEIKIFAKDFIITKRLDFPGKVSNNVVDARKEIDSILRQY